MNSRPSDEYRAGYAAGRKEGYEIAEILFKPADSAGRGKEDGVSTTTGATAEQIEAAAKRKFAADKERKGLLFDWDYVENSPVWLEGRCWEIAFIAQYLVPPGKVIASAADVAKVPTSEELAAMRELVSNAPGFDETLDALTVVRAYLERVTE